MLVWLAIEVVLAAAALTVEVPTWALVHVLLLGVVSNAILIWSSHFAAAMLNLPVDTGQRALAARLVAFNVGVAVVIGGMLVGVVPVVVVGAGLAAGAVGWQAVVLSGWLRSAPPTRLGPTVWYYVVAGFLLIAGVVIGTLMAPDSMAQGTQARLVLAHIELNVLGWVGLTLVGTLVQLWPTMLRTPLAAGSERSARLALPVLLVGCVGSAAALLAGAQILAALGLAAYLIGLVIVGVPLGATAVSKPPNSYATRSVLAACAWFVGCLIALIVMLLINPEAEQVTQVADRLAAPLLVGFAAQLIVGAMSFLIPVVLGGGPATARATNDLLDRAGIVRLMVINLGVALVLLPVPQGVVVGAGVAVLAAFAVFPVLAVSSVVVAYRRRRRPW